MGIDVPHPRFGWALPAPSARGERQAAFQLAITRQGDSAPLWDSQRIASAQTTLVTANVTLAPDASYDWRVRWWSSADPSTPSPWLSSTFSTGIGSAVDPSRGWLTAEWVVPTKIRGSGMGNQLRKEFELPTGKVIRGALYVTCLGYYAAEVNGARVSNKLIGDFTNFEKRGECLALSS